MKVELMPAIDEGTVSVEATFRSGTKVSEVDARMQELEAMVAAHPDVESYTLTSSKGSGSISVNLKDKRKMSSQEVADQWMEETKDMTGIQLDITVSSQMSSMMATSSGASSDAVLNEPGRSESGGSSCGGKCLGYPRCAERVL